MPVPRTSARFVALLAGALLGCGSSASPPDGGGGGDARRDAGPDATTVNALGQLCDGAHPCPLGNTCLTIANTGSQEQGFCTPACNGVNDVCWAGYAGPATGAPTCEGPICTIHCRVDEDCPAPLGCRPDTESFGWFCVVP